MREKAASFLNSVLGGVCIGIGGVVFLSCENKVTGAVLSGVGWWWWWFRGGRHPPSAHRPAADTHPTPPR